MDSFLNSYKHLHKTEKAFLSSLPKKCERNSPEGIKDVKVIGKVLSPKDPAFKNHDDEMVIKKFFIVREMTIAVLSLMRPYLCPKHQAWFDGKGAELQSLLSNQMMSAASLQCSVSEDQVSVMTCGVGGINATVKATIQAKTLERLLALSELLKSIHEQQ